MKTKDEIKRILAILEKSYPQAKTALRYSNAFELLVATILSAQCTDAQVNKVTEKLFAKYKTLQDFAVLSADELAEEIKSCGLYKTKARNIVETSKILIERYGSRVPDTLEELQKLPGVGRKTANVVISNAFGKPAIAVDTHVFRVTHRLGLAQSTTAAGTEKELMEKIPKELWSRAHHWFIYHGRNVCRARQPKCNICPLREHCDFIYQRPCNV